ncbi:ABC transporter permease [Verticiella sediminum]|uniref:Cell division protein FtsX n=1 Tax=Verticiella sediminum TaxID=1247510 RepID=A0A556B035_9BURK|nr:ABC transporter permease [Verticiella sediminum]TSH98534.1 ABC transporter permease [Verticiella sediminum]
MNAWVRQHRYALGVTLRRLAAQPFSSLANIFVIALALSIPLLGAAILISAQPVARDMSTGPELTVFMQPGAQPSAAEDVAQRIARDHAADVADVRVVPRERALAELKADTAWAEALAALPDNPLPDAVIVSLAGADFAQRAGKLADAWRELPGVDKVQLDSEWVQRLQAILRFAGIGLWLLAVGVAIAVLATVFNTVRMQALAQREEITVARLVGATERFVRRPFLYLGAVTVGVAGLLAIAGSALGLALLNDAVRELARSYGSDFALQLPALPWLAVFVIGGALLGAFSARWSVTRNTRF